MPLEYRADGRWVALHGQALDAFAAATGAQVGARLPVPQWLALPFYDFTALIRLPDAAGGASEWYLTNGGRFWALDRFGVAISAMNERANLSLTRQSIISYLRFWCAFTTQPTRYHILDVSEPELAAEAADETDPLLRGVTIEGQGPQGWLLSATVFQGGQVQRRSFRVTAQGQVEALEKSDLQLPARLPLRRAG